MMLHPFITLTMKPPSMTQDSNDATTTPELTPRQIKAKRIQKYLDRGLNLLLVVSAVMWIVNHYFMPDAQEMDNARALKALQRDAESAFKAAKNNDYSVTINKPRPTLPKPAVAFMASDLQNIMEDKGELPTLVFFYASWCPYCHKMFPMISKIAQTMQDKIRIVPISIDEKPEAFITYLNKHEPNPSFTPYVFGDSGERLKARDLLAKKGLQFTGSIPYMSVFRKGEALAQITGVMADEDLLKFVKDAGSLHEKTTITEPSSTSQH